MKPLNKETRTVTVPVHLVTVYQTGSIETIEFIKVEHIDLFDVQQPAIKGLEFSKTH